jgi:cell division protein FtsB
MSFNKAKALSNFTKKLNHPFNYFKMKATIELLSITAVSLANILLEVPMNNFDFIGIADKITTIGILLYISYNLNQKLEKLSENFRAEEKEIRDMHRNEMLEQRKFYENIYDKIDKKNNS